MRKTHLYSRSSIIAMGGMTPAERRVGRFLRDNEGHPGGGASTGGTPSAQGDNTGGNSPPGTQAAGSGDNAGQQFDPASFWNPPSGGETGSPPKPGGSAESGTPPAEGSNIGQTLQASLQGLTVPPLMTQQMATELGEGNFDNFNAGLVKHGQEVARQTLGMAVQVMKVLRDQMMTDVDSRLGSEFSNRESDSALEQAIPSAKNPAMAPMVKSIFTQAMKTTGGKRDQAIEMTKQMLRFSNQTLAQDDGLGIPAPSPADAGFKSTTNWLEELTGR